MKKIITALCVTALLASLTACSKEENNGSGIPIYPSSGSTSPESSGDSESSDNSDSSPESTESTPESLDSAGFVPDVEPGEPTLEQLIDGFPLDEITLPDGTVIKKTEATEGLGSADYSILKFDVAVVHYCKPIFQSNLDDPDSFDWENYAFLDPAEEPAESRNVTVRAGDVLENGMTVKTAYTYFEAAQGEQYYKDSRIELEGEQTAEGIIYLREEDDYGVFKDHLEFYADTAKTDDLPMRYDQYGTSTWTHTFPERKVAITSDGDFFDLGDINEINVDVSEIFLDSPFARVKVTFKDPVLRITETASIRVMAELVDIELL
ncbi:MAG: hypothetical protein HDT43_09495 [Ruminococcaceae bacterium]|nr:hypothetical protein [Oscillospiraceae bacterium]